MNTKASSFIKNTTSTKYPQFTFRLREEDKVKIEKLLKKVEKQLSDEASKVGKKASKRNEIITQLLIDGLESISKQLPEPSTKKAVRRG